MTDRPHHRRSFKPTDPARPRRTFTMVPIQPAEWALTINLLRLSPMQANIVAMLVQDADEREVCEELGLTRATVRVYLTDIFRHVGVTNRRDLCRIIMPT